jgi:serine/threonine-protein phosphatase 4 catalytic subunit
MIRKEVLFVHGGIPTQGRGIEDIAYAHSLHPVRPHLTEILWSDPMDENGIKDSPRGAGFLFGPNISKKFLDKISVKSLIRGHQSVREGYKIDHNRLFTVFSSRTRSYKNTKRAALIVEKNSSFEVEDLLENLVFY